MGVRSRLLYVARTAYGLFSHPGFEGTRITPRRAVNLALCRWEHRKLRSTLRSYPFKLIVEVTNVCNLKCPACFTGDGQRSRVRGHMPLDLYMRVLEELGPYLWRVELCNWGEPMLGKNLAVMVDAATKRGISSALSTNFSVPYDAGRAEELVRCGLTKLGVSIDGARQETYEKYRVGGDLETVLRNVRLVADAKRRLGSRTPRLIWSFHVFPHNTEDIEPARRMAAELGMEIEIEKGWLIGREWDPGGRFHDAVAPAPFPCVPLWGWAVLNHDGGVAPCCGTFYREDDVGRMSLRRDDGGATSFFRDVWNGAALVQARRMYTKRDGDESVRRAVCFDCPQTLVWERWRDHVFAGGSPESFDPGFGTQELIMHFWNRRPTQRPELHGPPPVREPSAD